MLTSAPPRRRLVVGATFVALTAVLIGLSPSPAVAQDDEPDYEGGTQSLREELDEAATAYRDAKAELDESEKRELELIVEMETMEEERDDLVDEIQVTAATAFRSGRAGTFSALLNSGSPDEFMERATTIEVITERENDQLVRLDDLGESIEDRQAKIAEEIAVQEAEVENLEEAKDQAEAALFAIGGGDSGEFNAFPSEDAASAPRADDGSFPSESCSESDPTTSGCLTPRTLHAYNEAQVFGFTRHTSCWRSGSFGEHPQGRACDFAASNGGFGGAATGADKEYGDRLASFLIHNSDALAVQYVIWYRQIWFPGSGWSSYGGAGGDPSSDHTNHVHLSVR